MPKINIEKCIKCNKCVIDCPSNAIDLSNFSISNTCIDCGHCVAICPEQAVTTNGANPIKLGPFPSFESIEDMMAGVRSVRSFNSKEVSKELVEKIISMLKHAPSASNTRNVEITILSDPEKIKQLDYFTGKTLISIFKKYTHPLVLPFVKWIYGRQSAKKLLGYRKRFEKQYANKDVRFSHKAPIVILLHAKKQMGNMYTADANIWATYITFAARSLGLATCFIGFYVNAFNRNKKLNAQFHIPSDHKVETTLVLGYPKVHYENEAGRNQPLINWY